MVFRDAVSQVLFGTKDRSPPEIPFRLAVHINDFCVTLRVCLLYEEQHDGTFTSQRCTHVNRVPVFHGFDGLHFIPPCASRLLSGRRGRAAQGIIHGAAGNVWTSSRMTCDIVESAG